MSGSSAPVAERWAELSRNLAGLARGGLAVAYSGGVDSSVLLHAATAAARAGDDAGSDSGASRVVGLIADSPSLPRSELAAARRFARDHGLELAVLATDELEQEAYRVNDGERCFHCKRTLFLAMAEWADERGFAHLAFGEITDDRLDVRPGARAARGAGVHAPLSAAGLGKREVRAYARAHGLEVADKPASACLASRIPRGREVTAERLGRVERAEAALAELGLRVVRARHFGEHARVEVGADELERARELAPELGRRLRAEGFETFELAAYRSPAERAALSAAGSAGPRPGSPARGS